jgi:arylsulfatase A-like enzyme
MKRNFIHYTGIILLLASCLSSPSQDHKATASVESAIDSPNFIIILVDDMGYADVGFNGCKDIPTPNIDRIAKNGVVFTEGYVTYAVCGPSRAGLITGRYQDRFGFGRNPLLAPKDASMGLPLSEKTIADAVKPIGYTSKIIGKWHLGAHESLHPLKRGFDEFYGFLSGGHRYFPKEWTLNDLSEARNQWDGYRTKLLDNYTRVDEKEYLTDALSREAVDFIERKANSPFFLYLAYNAPHAPLQATETYLERFPNITNPKRKTYAAMVSAVDDGVGRVLDALEQSNITENTMVVFLSDNGGPEQNNGSDNGILRGGKGDYYEGGIRVPFAMQWPGKIPAGTTFEHPVISLDIFATMADIVDYAPSKEHTLDGVNLLPYLSGDNHGIPHHYLFWRNFDAQKFAIRGTDYKLWKSKNSNELYHIKNDIGEQDNVLKANQNIYESMEKATMEWEGQMMDPVFLGLLQGQEYEAENPSRWVDRE